MIIIESTVIDDVTVPVSPLPTDAKMCRFDNGVFLCYETEEEVAAYEAQGAQGG